MPSQTHDLQPIDLGRASVVTQGIPWRFEEEDLLGEDFKEE